MLQGVTVVWAREVSQRWREVDGFEIYFEIEQMTLGYRFSVGQGGKVSLRGTN